MASRTVCEGPQSHLSGAPEAKFPKELIIDIRHLLMGSDDTLAAHEIVYFPRAAT